MLTGTARDLLIGITVVRADGVVAQAGGRVVKNVAGYDIGKLMVGSFGTLAVITEATFRLHPVPEVRRWVTVDVDDPDRAPRAGAGGDPLAGGALGGGGRRPRQGALSVLLGGRPDGVDVRVRAVEDLIGGTVSDTPPDGWGSYPWREGQVGFKLTFALSGLRDVLTAARDAGCTCAGRPASVSRTPRPTTPRRSTRLRAVCALHGGTVVVVDAPDDVKRVVDVWGPVPALDLMRRVKDQFDPDHRLSPGRFVGGI